MTINAFSVLDGQSNADLRELAEKQFAFRDDVIAIVYETLFDDIEELARVDS